MSIGKQVRLVVAVALALASVTMPVSARADGPGAAVVVQAGWDGQVRAGALVPIWVDVTAGPQPVQGKLQLHYSQFNQFGQGTKPKGLYALEVTVPAGGHVRKLMLVQNDTGGSLGPLELVVNGEAVVSEEIKLESQSVTRLVGVLGDDAAIQALAVPEPTVEPGDASKNGPAMGGKFGGGMPTVLETARPIRLIHLDPTRLPDRGVGLDGLDVVVLDRFAAGNLTPEQRRTLQAYVVGGGRLVLAGGPEGATVIAPFADWLGVQLGAVQDRPFSGRQVPIRPITGAGLRTVAKVDGQPVALAKNMGAGSVLLLTYDPALAPLAGWAGRKPFWDDLLRGLFPATAMQNGLLWGPGGGGPGGMDVMQLGSAVQRVPTANMPDQTRWLLILGGYALLLGPVNFLLWRLLKRPGLAWPVALAGAAGATLLLWPLARRLDPAVIINPAAVLYTSSGSSVAKVAQVVAVNSLPEAVAEVAVPGADWVSMVALPPMGPFNGPPPITEDLGTVNLDRNSVQVKSNLKGGLQAIYVTGTMDLGGSLEADLHLEQDHLVGSVTNKTTRPWHDLTLAAGQSFLRLSALLKPGESAKVSFLLPSALPPGGCCGMISVGAGIGQAFQPVFNQGAQGPGQEIAAWPMMQRMNLGQVVANHFWQTSGGNYQIVLVGWTDEVPLPVTVGGRDHASKGVVMLGQEVPLVLGRGAYSVPAGVLPMVNTAWNSEDNQFGNMFGPENGVPLVGSAEYSLHLPEQLHAVGVKSLTVALPMPQGMQGKGPVTELWNIATQSWQTVTVQGGQENKIADGRQFVSADGEVRVRISRHEKPDPQRGIGMYPIGKPLVGVQGEEAQS